MGFKDILIGTLIVGLCLFALVNFGIQTQVDNNSTLRLTDNYLLNDSFGDLNSELGSNLSGSQSLAESQREGFETEIPTEGDDNFKFKSIISTGKSFTGMLRNLYNVIFGLIFKSLGINTGAGRIIFGTIATIIIITIIFLLWRAYRSGS